MIQRTEIVDLTALYYHGLNAYSQTGLNNNYDVEQSHAAYSVNSGRYESKSSSNGILNRVFTRCFIHTTEDLTAITVITLNLIFTIMCIVRPIEDT